MVHWLRFHLPKQGVRAQSQVGELRSYKPCGQKTKKKVKQKQCRDKLSKDVKNGPHHTDRKSSVEAVILVI